jgi:hypothetical protein
LGGGVGRSKLDELVYNALVAWSKIMVTGLPLVFVVISAAFLILTPRPPEGCKRATAPLRIAGVLCAGIWIFIYAEDGSRRPFFDIGAPIISLLALPVLPLLALLIWRQRRVLATLSGHRARFIVANALILFSLGPGVFLVFFYAAAMHSSR